MKVFMLLIVLPGFLQLVAAQNKLTITVADEITRQPLIGAALVLKGAPVGAISDAAGRLTLTEIPAGIQVLVLSYIGYQNLELSLTFPLSGSEQGQVFYLKPSDTALEEVKVTSSRSSRNISDIPTRIETIALGELEEKSVMQPGNIKMLLTESTGIQTQQTSQVSGSAAIRIQGLDGKYTQLLQDGFPLYAGFASGLSILQIPPLNLRRVEVIKGSSSTLYGGGAIAGLVNLITKEPAAKPEASLLANVNQTGALDLSGFYAQKHSKTGITMYAAANGQRPYDNNHDGFSDIPRFTRYTVNPKFYYYPDEHTKISLGFNGGFEKRSGGDMRVLDGHGDARHQFFEDNNSNRYTTQFKFDRTFADHSVLSIKNSVGYFRRRILRRDYSFEGQQVSSFTEASYHIPAEKSEWSMGINYVTDKFRQLHTGKASLNYFNGVLGAFAQNNFDMTDHFILESGLRVDVGNQSKVYVLPRLALLCKISPGLTARLSSGLGYKMPAIFSEDAEERAFRDIEPIGTRPVKAEHSYGFNGDIDFKRMAGEELSVSVNQMFFYTTIRRPLVLTTDALKGTLFFENADGVLNTRGLETNVKLIWQDFSTYLGYTFIDASRNFSGSKRPNPLTSKHRINANLMYETDEKLRIAYEVFYVGPQYLSSGTKVRNYWVMGASAEYRFLTHVSLFINFENFLDVRQSRWEPMYSGSALAPVFSEVYTPTDGFIFNGGFRLRL